MSAALSKVLMSKSRKPWWFTAKCRPFSGEAKHGECDDSECGCPCHPTRAEAVSRNG